MWEKSRSCLSESSVFHLHLTSPCSKCFKNKQTSHIVTGWRESILGLCLGLQNDKIGSKNYMRMKSQDSVSLVPLGTLLKGDFSAAGGENATVEETKKTELHMSVERMVLHIDLRAPETSKQLPSMWLVQILMERKHSLIDLSLPTTTRA